MNLSELEMNSGEKEKNLGYAFQNFGVVLTLEPNNPEALRKQKICLIKMKLLINPNSTPLQPWPVPNYHEEYIKKYGSEDKENTSVLEKSFDALSFETTKDMDELMQEIENIIENTILYNWRWGYCLDLYKSKNWKPGEVLDVKRKTSNITYYPKHYHTMKNHKIALRTFSGGETHISLGCVDFAQLLFGTFAGDLKQEIHFLGIGESNF